MVHSADKALKSTQRVSIDEWRVVETRKLCLLLFRRNSCEGALRRVCKTLNVYMLVKETLEQFLPSIYNIKGVTISGTFIPMP